MDLFEYIKSQLPQMPNSAIMKQMGASKELIDYVKETPWNTNLNIFRSLSKEEKVLGPVINITSDWNVAEHSGSMPPGSSWTDTTEAWGDCISHQSTQPYVTIILDGVSLDIEFTVKPGSYGPPTVEWSIDSQRGMTLTQSGIYIYQKN